MSKIFPICSQFRDIRIRSFLHFFASLYCKLYAFGKESLHIKRYCFSDILSDFDIQYLVVSLMWLYQPPIIKLQKQFENCKLFALMMKTWQSLLYSNTMFVCMCVCLRPISSRTAGPIWLNFFLLASSWSHDGFRPKKFRIRDPVFPEIRKNPGF